MCNDIVSFQRGGKREKECCREDSSEDSGCELCDEMVVNNNSAKVEVGSWDSSVFEFEQDQADQVSSSVIASSTTQKFTVAFIRYCIYYCSY